MTTGRFLLASLRHYWLWHAGLALGVAIAGSVICGSLAVGDSVRATLRQHAAERLGHVQTALIGNDRFFTETLVDALPGNKTALIAVRGTIANADGSARVVNVNVLGVTDSFWRLALRPLRHDLANDSAVFNQPLARALGTAPGETVVIRMEKPSALSKEAPLSGEADQTVTLRLRVAGTATAPALGDFSLNASQSEPKNVFVRLTKLQETFGQPKRVNLGLTDSVEATDARLAAAWSLDDANLTLRKLDNGEWEIATPRVFLDPVVADKIRTVFPSARGVLTYLVNEIRASPSAATPYSMATAAESLFELGPDEVAVTQWTADDLELKPGDPLTLKFYYFSRGREMEERAASFAVKSVLPMDHSAVRRDWTPDFPGVMDKPDCRDWNPGIKMDMTRIRPRDQEYWANHRGTPKVFLALETGQQLWGNRFGTLTSLRLPADALTDEGDFLTKLQEAVQPADFGLGAARPAMVAREAVDQSYDLGTLFLGMSFFLIATALLLTALMFLFTWENRAAQLGVLMTVGLDPKRVRRLMMWEAGWASVLGAVAGLGGGLIYSRLVLRALSGAWGGAVGGLSFVPAGDPWTLAAAAAATCILAVATVWLTAWRLLRAQPKDLVAGGVGEALAAGRGVVNSGVGSRRHFMIGWALLAMLSSAAAFLAWKAAGNPAAFFGAGALLMVVGVVLAAIGLRYLRWRISRGALASYWQLSLRNTTRKSGRSLAVAGLLAAGVFMISAMDAFRLDASATDARDSGTGGFAFVGESTLPIYEDLNSRPGRESYGLDEADFSGVSFVPFRVREGDEASCLNLERPQNPRIIGVRPEHLAARAAFAFTTGPRDWSVLDGWSGIGPIPAVMDANYVQYTLKAKLGDTLEVADDRNGVVILRIAALLEPSVLQGSAVISESAFLKAFSESGGYRFFLVDAHRERRDAVAKTLMRQLEDRGFSLTPSGLRLDEYNTVQNTYLRIFTALGGLGLILSTAGLGLLLARNVLERRREFGLLLAVGLPRRTLRRIVIGENSLLLVAGLFIGVFSALLAVWPVSGKLSLPVAIILAILAGGLLFCSVAAHLAMRGQLIEALRSE
ncbi:MAG: FtsX-like permease family protein [Verrucomicrobiales bacterium]